VALREEARHFTAQAAAGAAAGSGPPRAGPQAMETQVLVRPFGLGVAEESLSMSPHSHRACCRVSLSSLPRFPDCICNTMRQRGVTAFLNIQIQTSPGSKALNFLHITLSRSGIFA